MHTSPRTVLLTTFGESLIGEVWLPRLQANHNFERPECRHFLASGHLDTSFKPGVSPQFHSLTADGVFGRHSRPENLPNQHSLSFRTREREDSLIQLGIVALMRSRASTAHRPSTLQPTWRFLA